MGHSSFSVTLNGARGGHSGGDIARGRINAIKALGRVLSAGSRSTLLRLTSLDGGVSRNAIPRDARAVVSIPAADEQTFRDAVEAELRVLRRQHAGADDGVGVVVAQVEHGPSASPETSAQALDLLTVVPTGVVAMSPNAAGTVETSTSLNVAGTSDGVLTLASMTRSASAAALEDVVSSLEAAARLAGASTEIVRSYPPWEPDRDSGLLATAVATFGRELLQEPRLEIVHGGLECAVIGSKLPGVEMLSLGPTIEGPHAPGERLSISGTRRFYGLLGALLDDLSA
jgi:dipeptidase D